MSKFFCLFDGRVLVSVPDYDLLKCTECEASYSGPFLARMKAEQQAKKRHPSRLSRLYYQNEKGLEK